MLDSNIIFHTCNLQKKQRSKNMSIKITFPNNYKVRAEMSGFVIETDQRKEDGGDSSAPTPYELFLASIGTCAGAYILGFCKSRGLTTEGIEIEQRSVYDPIQQKIGKIILDIKVPDIFPEKYYNALIRAVEMCAVKKTIENPPLFEVNTKVITPSY